MPITPVRRFLVFAGDTFYPGGGWLDFRGSFDTIEEAYRAAAGTAADWWQIVDAQTSWVLDRKGD